MATRLMRASFFHLHNKLQRLNSRHSIGGCSRCSNFHTNAILDKRVAFNLSDIGEGIRDVVIKEWFVKVGDTVQQFDDLCEVQSDKASVTITSRYDGKILKIYKSVDEIALVGKPLLDFEVVDEEQEKESSTSSSSSLSSDVSEEEETFPENNKEKLTLTNKALATPAVRRIAMEHKINLVDVPATGKLGRVLKGDVLEYLNLIPPGSNKPHPSIVNNANTSAIAQETSGNAVVDRIETLKGVRKAMLKTMIESQKIPHFGYSDEIDVTKLVQLRTALKTEAESAAGVKLTFMPFFIKAASLALLKFPILNSSLNVTDETVHYKMEHNISVAIAAPDGLVVPNVKNCQTKSILRIAKDLNDLQVKAQEGKLRPEDFANGTFSLSNIGIIGGTYLHACILPPQVSIGALGKIKIVPRFDSNGNVCKAHIMNVSWTADHRVIDGVTMARFSEVWKEYLENPQRFLLSN